MSILRLFLDLGVGFVVLILGVYSVGWSLGLAGDCRMEGEYLHDLILMLDYASYTKRQKNEEALEFGSKSQM
jgi:hypothetical protein